MQVYLNHNFKGGKTSFRAGTRFLDIKPKTGVYQHARYCNPILPYFSVLSIQSSSTQVQSYYLIRIYVAKSVKFMQVESLLFVQMSCSKMPPQALSRLEIFV